MKSIKLIPILFLSCSSLITSAQERITTFGVQFKPIIPIDFINSGNQSLEKNNILYQLKPQPGLNFGMVIRKGFTKNISLETGINILRRNYDLSINDLDSSFLGTSNFRIINYEIPVAALVYVRLADNLFMNVSGGFSLDIYPSDLFTYDDYFENAVNRFGWIRTSLIANVGWEFRTKKSGYFYLGASFHRPFSKIMREYIHYRGFNKSEQATFDLSGNYLTIDFRYFFHEDKVKKKKKTKKEVKKDFRQPRPPNKPKLK